jgi:gamma-glutamyltranspeptidase/glutathione hydrolase
MRRLAAVVTLIAVSLNLVAPAGAQLPGGDASGPAKVWPTQPHAMVAAANPLAVAAGVEVLRGGGSAIDAAVAVQAVLGLVEPQSSGLGGGAFMVYYDAKTHAVSAYDGRETAPRGASPTMFMGDNGRPLSYGEAVLSGNSTGAPGAIAMLGLAQREHGVLPWRDLFGAAQRMAADGFVVSPRLAFFIGSTIFPQAVAPDVVAYFTKPDGTRYKAGDVLKNPAYAATLGGLAANGPEALYTGQIADDIAARIHQAPRPGTLTAADLAAYRPKKTPALCRPYRAYRVCTNQDPSGGSGLLEALGLLERTDIAKRGPNDPMAWFELIQAQRLMYADRDRYIGDPAFVTSPSPGLLDPAYLDARAVLIGEQAGPAPAPGHPKGAPVAGLDRTIEPGGTSHMVIADARGDVLSMTTTVESIFGSGRMVHGYFLNNQLTDFSYSPVDSDGTPAANAVAPGKRPRSAMSPVIVLDKKGRFVVALGSPGGPAILAYNLKALVGILDWKLTVQQAFALPNVVARGDRFNGETNLLSPTVLSGLAARGVRLTVGFGENSGLHGVAAAPGGWSGGADPRREGVVEGF